MSNEMKDWPHTLKLNAVSCELAQMIYYFRFKVYGGRAIMWEDLEPEMRGAFTNLASDMLKELAPPNNVALIRALQLVKR